MQANADQPAGFDPRRVRAALTEVLAQELGLPGLPEPTEDALGGELELVPGRTETKSKTLGVAQLLRKLTSVRDRLRLMEQTINASSSLSEERKLVHQTRITRAQEAVVALGALLLR